MKKPVKVAEARGIWEKYQRSCGHIYFLRVEFAWCDKDALRNMRQRAAESVCMDCAEASEESF